MPVIVDAAAELPPTANLSHFLDEDADLAVFSGGKALGGPQDSGLLLGRPDLVRSALYQQLDMDTDPQIWRDHTGTTAWQHGIGRAMKVGPTTTFALLTALREFLSRDHEQEAAEMSGWLQELAAVAGTGRLVPPRTADGFYPSLVWEPGPSRAREAWHALARRHPSIRLAQGELAAGLLRLRPEALAPDQREIVCSALAELRPSLQKN